MAINTQLPKLTEAELNNPDLDDDGELDVERYPLPSGDEIKDRYLAKVWNEAIGLVENSEGSHSSLDRKKELPVAKASWVTFEEAVLHVISEIGRGAQKFVGIAELGHRIGFSPETLHATLLNLWREGKINMAAPEGRFGSTEEERRWWLRTGGETFGHVMLRR